ncbi:MAG: winged helix-turn-helix transcriptional regulator [Gemmatimonadaceae bacterium]|nr:winged helix-turn-helix transcriptional regulator [Gemmatimonadaceae bacterium]
MSGSNAVFRALADPTRREIVKLLRAGPMNSGDIAERFPSAWATISRHLAVLREADLISAERNGNSIRYELNATVLQELIEHIFDWTKKGADNA